MLVLVGGLVACDHRKPPSQSVYKTATRVLRRGLPGEPRTLDPHLADDEFSLQVIRDLYEGLTAEDAAGKIEPGAAVSWTINDSGTSYVFHLRPGAKWSNGAPLTAGEFVEGLRRAVDPKTGSGDAELLAVIRGASDVIAGRKKASELGVTALDDSSVRIDLEHPAPFVLQVLSQPIAAPLYDGKPVTSSPSQADRDRGPYDGAYVLADRVPGSFIELSRNPNYWNSSKVAIDRVRYVNAESETTELHEYIAGQLDMTSTVPLADLGRITQILGKEVQVATTLGTIYLALNLSKPPFAGNHDLREALSIAVDRQLIAEHVMTGVEPAYAFVAQGAGGYAPPKYDWMSWDRDRQLAYARVLYARAGYSEKNPIHLRLYFPSRDAIQRTMIAVAASWEEHLGVVSELISDEFQVFLGGRKDRSRWDVAWLRWNADYDDPSSFLDVLAPASSQNDPDYVNPSFSALIQRATTEPLPEVRMNDLRNAEQVMLDDYPIIPIYFTRGRRLVKPYLGGAQITPMNRTYSKNLFWK